MGSFGGGGSGLRGGNEEDERASVNEVLVE
jgi:hypothetical protein